MTDTSPLPPYLLETIQRGNAVLFLGAGATIGAKGKHGESSPSGEQLRDLLADKFLGGNMKSKSLSQVAEYAKSEASLPDVQTFIRECFDPLQPADFHLLIPHFRWFAIVTTNYDLVVERAYTQQKTRLQHLEPLIQDGDQFSDVLRDPTKVAYLKLHGCITHVNDPGLPLILASEEYTKFRKNRDRLFKHFADWAREHPVIFCGYDVGDPNIQQVIFDLSDIGISRPMYGLVNPDLDPIAQRYWAGKRFAILPQTFETFLRALDSAIPEATRPLGALIDSSGSSITSLIRTHAQPSGALLKYLQDELEHVYKGMPTVGVSPAEFYKGGKADWGAFQQGLDVRRRASDDLILDAFLGKRESTAVELHLLRGHAGSGKSIALRRIAWDIACEYGGIVFSLKEGGLLRREHLLELSSLIGERLFVVLEDAIPHVSDVQNTLSWAEKNRVSLTLIAGARTNEWNVYAGDLETRTTNEYELRDLTEREIRQLLERLEKFKLLGRLGKASTEERLDHFRLTAERQLLVALHDLTGDKPFEEIVYDEYLNVVPTEARILYMDVCTLHRLGVGIRAGLVSRISGITFEDFSRDFFRPLEHVIHTYFDYSTRDNMYRSRHREIAEMVFSRALRNPSERADQIVRIIRSMDVDYATDEAAFRQILRGRALADQFADKHLALRIFDAALESGAPISVVEHQRAVFELNHRGGDLRLALTAIEKAERSQSHADKAILHTKAAVLRELAMTTPQRLARSKLRDEAKAILGKHITSSRVPHPFTTMGHILIDELRDKLSELAEDNDGSASELKDRAVAELIRGAEQVVEEGLQRFPGDQYLLDLEAALARILTDEQRALSALRKAFEANPGKAFIAVRFSLALQRQQDKEGGKGVLLRSIASNPSGKEAHFALAKLLIEEDEIAHKDDIAIHLKRSFTRGDSNLDAQFWTARHNFLYGDRDLAYSMFQELARTWIPAEYRNDVKGVVREKDGGEKWFRGSIKKLEDQYCYMDCPDLRCDVFAHANDIRNGEWARLATGTGVRFTLGFTFRGPRTKEVYLLAD